MKHISHSLFLSLCCFMAASVAFASGRKDKQVDAKAAAATTAVESSSEKEAEQDETDSADVLRVGSLNGPSSIPVAYLYENAPDLGGTKATFELCATPVVELPKLLKGELDIGFLPLNAAAKVYTKNNGSLILLGISGNGNLSLLTTDKSYVSLENIKGKKIAMSGQGATPEYIFRYILGKKSIGIGEDSEQTSFDFSIPTAEIAAALISGKVSYALLPEPFATVATMKSTEVKRVADIQNIYEQLEGKGSTYPLTVLVCRAAYAKEHPETVAKFVESYKKATEWTVENPAKSGVLVQKYTLGLLAPIAAKSIPNGSYVWIPALEGRKSIEKLIKIYMDFAPEAVGGALPADGFYYVYK